MQNTQSTKNTKICVFGMWHLGCVTAACLAEKGFHVTGIDPSEETVAGLNKGQAPLFEPDLNELIQKQAAAGNLKFCSIQSPALKGEIAGSKFVWVTFDTPVDENDNADSQFVKDKILEILPFVSDGSGIIISSQLPAGSTRELEESASRLFPSKKVHFAYSPENLRLGNALSIFRNPDRVVVGVRDGNGRREFEAIFSAISGNVLWMGTESAEMVKHAINSFLAMSVSFCNEIASACEKVGANALEVERGMKSEQRIGQHARLHPGLAFAGGTLARDVRFLEEIGKTRNSRTTLLSSILESNERHKKWVEEVIMSCIPSIEGVDVAVIGLAYKKDTSTLRRSLSIELCEWLFHKGAIVHAFDPNLSQLPPHLEHKVHLHQEFKDAIQESKTVVMLTSYPFLIYPDDDMRRLLSGRNIIDPNHVLEKEVNDTGQSSQFNQSGQSNFRPAKYFAVGRVME